MSAASVHLIAATASGVLATVLQLALVVALSVIGSLLIFRRGRLPRGQDEAPDAVSRMLGRVGVLPPEMRRLRREMRGDLRRIRRDVVLSRREHSQLRYEQQARVLTGLLGGELSRIERNEVHIQEVVLHVRRARRGRAEIAEQVVRGEHLRLERVRIRGLRLRLEFCDRHRRRFPIDLVLRRVEVRR